MMLTASDKVPTGGTDVGVCTGLPAVGGPRDMFFIWESFLRLEYFVRECPSYTRNVGQALAVVFSYTALALYLLFFVVCRVYRGVAIVGFLLGFSVSGGLVTVLARCVPSLHRSAAPCALDTDNRAAEEATVVVYSTVFVVLYDYAFVDTRWTAAGCQRVLKYTVVAAAVTVAGTVSPYVLGVQTSAALLVGSSAGIVTACLTVVVLTHLTRLHPSQRVFCRELFNTEADPLLYERVPQTDSYPVSTLGVTDGAQT